jgi:hypothetical protein
MMADAAYGEGVAQALGIAVRDIVKDTTALVAT